MLRPWLPCLAPLCFASRGHGRPRRRGAGTRRPRRAAAPPPWALPPPVARAIRRAVCGLAARRGRRRRAVPVGRQLPALAARDAQELRASRLWAYRERFFHEGMRLEIGACFADYGPPEFYRAATETFRGRRVCCQRRHRELHRRAALPDARDHAPRIPRRGSNGRGTSSSGTRARGSGRLSAPRHGRRDGKGEPFEGETFKAQLSSAPTARTRATRRRARRGILGGRRKLKSQPTRASTPGGSTATSSHLKDPGAATTFTPISRTIAASGA